MKKFLDGIKIGLGFISISTVFLIIGFYLVKARNGTTASPGDKLTANKWNELVNQINTLSGNISSISLSCILVQGTAEFQGVVSGRGNYTVIKRAICPDGYKVTGCSGQEAPATNFANEAYSYFMPRLGGRNGTNSLPAKEGCQRNSEYTSTSYMNNVYSNTNRTVNAICCKIN